MLAIDSMMLLNLMRLLKPTIAVCIVTVPMVAETLHLKIMILVGPSTIPAFTFLFYI